jgi:sarcosine oxidase subunit delta
VMHLACPWCGYRNVSEFGYLGELRERPDPATTTPEEWRAYLYLRRNPAGRHDEGWYHRAGCRKYFEAVRDTTDNTVSETRPPTRHPDSHDEGEHATAGDLDVTSVSV